MYYNLQCFFAVFTACSCLGGLVLCKSDKSRSLLYCSVGATCMYYLWNVARAKETD